MRFGEDQFINSVILIFSITGRCGFLTAPDLMEYTSDNHFRERLGALTNRTYRGYESPIQALRTSYLGHRAHVSILLIVKSIIEMV